MRSMISSHIQNGHVDEWHFSEVIPEADVVITISDEICYLAENSLDNLVAALWKSDEIQHAVPALVNGGRADHLNAVMGRLPTSWAGKFILETALRADPRSFRPESGVIVHERLLLEIEKNQVGTNTFQYYYFKPNEYICPDLIASKAHGTGTVMVGNSVAARLAWPQQSKLFDEARIKEYYDDLVFSNKETDLLTK